MLDWESDSIWHGKPRGLGDRFPGPKNHQVLIDHLPSDNKDCFSLFLIAMVRDLAVRLSSYGYTWEVGRALVKLELAPQVALTLFLCISSFPHSSIIR